jgi:hypothetical protein
MQTHTITTYSFEELNEAAKEKAIDANRDINVEYWEWWHTVYDDAKMIGLKLTGFDITYHPTSKGSFIDSAYDTAKLITENHGKDCDTFKLATSYISELGKLQPETDFENCELSEDLNDKFLSDLLKCYATMLNNEFDYLTSDEAIKETLISNDYQFLEDGTKY